MRQLVSKVLNIRKGVVRLLVLFSLCVSVLSLIIPIAVQTIVNTLAFSTLKEPLFILVIVVIFVLLIAGIVRVCQLMIVENVQQRFFVDIALLFATLLPRLKLRELNSHRGPEIINRFFEVIPIQKTLAILLIYLIELVIQAITSFILLAFYHPYLLILDGLLILSFFLALFLPYAKAMRSALGESDYKHKMVAWLEEYLHCRTLFKFNNNDDYLLKKVDDNITQYLSFRSEHFKQILKHFIGFYSIYIFANAALLGVGGYLVLAQQLTLGQLVASELVLNALVYSFLRMCYYLRDLYALVASSHKINSVLSLDYEPCIKNLSEQDERSEQHLFQAPPTIDIEGFSFISYLGRRGLTNFSLSITAGEIVCLDTESKTGKIALLDSLLGFNSNYQGSIRINGKLLTNKEKLLLRKKAYLVNDIEFFPGTLYENITLNQQAISVASLNFLFKQLDILKDIESLPEGVNSILLDHKLDLSHATLYKLAIARAILANPLLLILDDVIDKLNKKDILLLIALFEDLESRPTIILTSRDNQNTVLFKRVVTV